MGVLDLPFLEQIALASNKKGKPVAKKAAKKTRGPNSAIDMEAFCKAYGEALKSGKTTKEFAESIGMTVANAQARKIAYSKKGLKFKPLARGSRGAKYTDAQIKSFQKLVGG